MLLFWYTNISKDLFSRYSNISKELFSAMPTLSSYVSGMPTLALRTIFRYANSSQRPSQLQPRKIVPAPAKRMLPARSSEMVLAKPRMREEERESSPEQEEREEGRELVAARSRELVVAKPSKARMREERREGLGGSSPDQLDSGFGLDSGTSR